MKALKQFVFSLSVLILLSAQCVAQEQIDESAAEGETLAGDVDPYIGFNRKMFVFNVTLDKWLLKPIAKGYDYVMPNFAQTGVNNFFSNLGEVSNFANDVLQWKWAKASNDSARFVVNSTFGIAGLFDVAEKFGLPEGEGEDVGQTLAHWGVKSGPYIVLPFLGPSTVRNGLALPVDRIVLDPVSYAERRAVTNSLTALRFVHDRAELFEIEELASGDLYLFIRDAYLQRREYLENDGQISEDYEDDFGDEDF